MEPIFELALRLPSRSSRHLLRELHGQLKTAIIEGRLKPGLRLPPTRTLASGLGVSRNTAVAAYDLLLSEGYLVARRGDGTYVADVIPRLSGTAASRNSDSNRAASTSTRDRSLNAFWWNLSRRPLLRPDSAAKFDFATGLPDSSIFPFDVWRRLSVRALRTLSSSPARYGESEGRSTLREAIARHVSFARAVACEPDDIVVTSGAQQAFDLLARVLVTPSRTIVAVENPGYPPTRAAFAAAGAKVVSIPVDEEGLVVQRLPPGTSVICVTPSHQFPMGTAMSTARRAALLEFAQKHRSVILEDDYDAEFRFGGRPLDALQTLDRNESVFYIGTFSKSLFPAIR
ncbi:MAG: PLP-dependent aminotransferase family protein, partial [Sinobacteraceae bacterium]|nr:PLP-dependent aminotransferase family protein [Nevskiaceae bacterium]